MRVKYLTYQVFDQWKWDTAIPTSKVSNYEGFTSVNVEWDSVWKQVKGQKSYHLLRRDDKYSY